MAQYAGSVVDLYPAIVEALHDVAYMDMIPFHGTEKQTMMETVSCYR